MAGISTSIQLQDRMSTVLNSITQSMSIMLTTFENTQTAVNSGLDSASMEAARQGISQASAELIRYHEELERVRNAPPPEPVLPTWSSPTSQPIFMNSGAERFADEYREADRMAQQLYQTQHAISNRAREMNVSPPGMRRDLEELENRMQSLTGRIQRLNDIPVNLRTDQVNAELERLRSLLGRANEAQSELNDAMSRMDISEANEAYRRLNLIINNTEQDIRDNFSEQERFNQSMQRGQYVASDLEGTLKRYASILLSASAAEKITSLADQVTQTIARLDLMNQRFNESEDLQQKIYESAQRSRGAYQTTSDAVAKLGMQARDAFSNTNEVVAFAEQLNKAFVIAGTSAQGVDSVMLQLTQSMASGKLQGEELNAVLDNAQPIVQNIADYMGVPVGAIKKLASEGAITAEIIKNAMFNAADETNAKFAQMPMTFGQVANSIENKALVAFRPALQQLSSVTQSAEFGILINSIVSGLQILASGAVQALKMIGQAAVFAQDNLWWLVPVISGVTTAVIAYKGAVVAYNIVRGISNTLDAVAEIRAAAHAAALAGESTATFLATAAQHGFNAALLACPLTWVVLAIMAVVVAIAIWINYVGGIKIAWLICVNFVLTWVDKFRLGFVTAGMHIQNAIDNMLYGFSAFKAGVLNALGSIRAQGLMILQDFVNSAIQMVNDLINAVNQITGVGISTITWTADFGSRAVAEEAEKRQNRTEDLANTKLQKDAASKERLWNKMRLEGELDSAKAARDAEIEQLKRAAAQKVPQDSVSGSAEGIAAANYGDIAGNVGGIAGNTAAIADQLDIMDEDLKYMRDAAEQEIINRFTLAELKVDVNNNNTLTKQTDFDDMGSYLAAFTGEFLQAAAEGGHI